MNEKKERPPKISVDVGHCGDAHSVLAKREDGINFVGMWNLRVVVTNDGETFFAQGLEIDYATEGNSLEDVQAEFTEGLRLTITEHLRLYGNLKKFQRTAPLSAWEEFFDGVDAKCFTYTQTSVHKIEPLKVGKIDFYIKAAA